MKNWAVLAVEAFEGTNEALKRGALLARKNAIMVTVAKPHQDMRFDIPVIGLETIRIAAEAQLRAIALEAGKALLLERDAMVELAVPSKISIVARRLSRRSLSEGGPLELRWGRPLQDFRTYPITALFGHSDEEGGGT